MSRRSPRAGRRLAPPTLLLAAIVGSAVLSPAGALAAAPGGAARSYAAADRAVIGAATRLARCQGASDRPTGPCVALGAALQKAGLKLSAAQLRLGRSAGLQSASIADLRRKAPVLSVAGTSLSWAKVADVESYVLVTKVPGRADRYSVVNGTSTTPAVVPGKTVTYGLRTAVVGSAWARQAKIAYPADSLAERRRAAPVITVDGQTLRWNAVADVKTYVFVTKVPGETDTYTVIEGTAITPAVRPGKTVRYGLSTNVEGARWAQEQSITYPAATPAPNPAPTPTPTVPPIGTPAGGTTPPPPPADPAPPAPAPDPGFEMGVVSGSAIQWELGFIRILGAKHVRMEFDINTPVSTMEPIIAGYAEAGIEPLLLAGFPGRSPTAAEARNLGTWAAAFGPGGTARQGKSWAPATAVTHIEFGNESNQPWQYPSLASNPDWPNSAGYADLARQYALRFKDARGAIDAANKAVGLLAIADTPGRWASWQNNLFATVPEFGTLVSGWVVHPYGPTANWTLAIDDAMAQAASHGAPSSVPIFVTEYGFATDNGRCLDDNYGWDKCMTYDQAAVNLRGAVAGMRARYGKRLAALYLYSAADLRATGTSTNREHYFGALHNDKSPKGAFTTEVVQELAAGA